MNSASLKISLSPRDHQFIKHLLPHQLKIWHQQVQEILIVLDLHGYDSGIYQPIISDLTSFIHDLSAQYPAIRLLEVDYADAAKLKISKAYFNSRAVPEKTHRYGPYYAYFYGLCHTKYDYVLNLDCDIFFGGDNQSWITQAIQVLQTENDVITCSPLPGPPRSDGKLISQPGQIDQSNLRKVYFDSFSTRLFFIHKPTFIRQVCPIPIKVAEWKPLLRALLRRKPVYALPEDVITQIMQKKRLKRADFLGTGDGIWSLHPSYRNEEFFQKLPVLIDQIENNKVPDAQRGDHDINDSMVNWDDAREEITNASIKRKFLSFLKID
jgi:hypothetical protein